MLRRVLCFDRQPGWAGLFLLLCCAVARAQVEPSPQALLQALNEISIDPSQVYVLRNGQFARDRVSFYLNRGVIGFLQPVRGEITGAVFAGDGEILLMPPDPIERHSLAYFTQSAILAERFTSVYLRFSDQTARELMAVARRPDPDDPLQPAKLLPEWEGLVRRLNPQFSARILMDLLGERAMPTFYASVDGSTLGTFQIEIDARLAEGIRVGAMRRKQDKSFADIWCSFPSEKGEAQLASRMLGSIQVKSYRIDTRIHPNHSLEGQAELEIESRSSADRVLIFELSRLLKVTEVRSETGETLTVFQNPSLEESETGARGNDWIVVVLAHPYAVGERFRLQFSYHGNVIADVGNGVLYVGERGSWYPNRGSAARAMYDLTFHYPERWRLVATGERVEETSADGWKHSRWLSRQPMAVAGFNLGAYRSQARKAGSLTVEVYATREVEAALEKQNLTYLPLTEVLGGRAPDERVPIPLIARPGPALDPAKLLDSVAEAASETVAFYESLFGPVPYSRLAISQVPGHFGQGWPGLVYLPTLAFLSKATRLRLGMDRRTEEFFNDLTLAHEIAHQWWGNHIGWLTYRDQWLSEGFATYSAALQLADGKDGERKLHDLLESYKADLLRKTAQGATVESGGPILLGHRLSNSLNPDGYPNIIYKKSCWVIHMLRVLMADGAKGRDERFFRMLRDFVATYGGQHPSTQEFIRHAEKYMTPGMDLDRNRRLDWFFDNWVYGTGIPTYKLEIKVRSGGARKYVAEGRIEQSGVSPEFETPVPLVAHYGKDRRARLGWVVIGETGGKFRFTTAQKPTRVEIDEDAILAVVK